MMDKQILSLASKMLELASNEFVNHGCNDLDEEVTNLIADEKTICEDIKKWNGDPECEWPEGVNLVSDHALMSYLAHKLKEYCL